MTLGTTWEAWDNLMMKYVILKVIPMVWGQQHDIGMACQWWIQNFLTGLPTPKLGVVTFYFENVCQNLHENERICTPSGVHIHGAPPPLGLPMHVSLQQLCKKPTGFLVRMDICTWIGIRVRAWQCKQSIRNNV